MPPDHFPPGSPQDWMARARASLRLAEAPKPHGALWEDLCFHAQQAADKAIKAVLLHKGRPFRYVHDIEELLTTAEKAGIVVPEDVRGAVGLTEYAVEARYPGMYEPVSVDEYEQALELARTVMRWAEVYVGSQ
ncbi:MAG: HEPN domain-containing protein [Planctomycetota bacterium]